MASDFRLAAGTADHWKLASLRERLGDGAFVCWIRLLGYAAANKPDGVLGPSDTPAARIEAMAGWRGAEQLEAGKFAEKCLELNLLEHDLLSWRIHNWTKHQTEADAREKVERQAGSMIEEQRIRSEINRQAGIASGRARRTMSHETGRELPAAPANKRAGLETMPALRLAQATTERERAGLAPMPALQTNHARDGPGTKSNEIERRSTAFNGVGYGRITDVTDVCEKNVRCTVVRSQNSVETAPATAVPEHEAAGEVWLIALKLGLVGPDAADVDDLAQHSNRPAEWIIGWLLEALARKKKLPCRYMRKCQHEPADWALRKAKAMLTVARQPTEAAQAGP